MRYPHKLLITREASSGGTQDPDTGAWTRPAGTTIYNGRADVQDEGKALSRDPEGRPTQMSDAVAYLENETAIGTIETGDHVTVTWEDGSTADARVQKVVRLDGKLHLQWV
jgi:hypothetical protein